MEWLRDITERKREGFQLNKKVFDGEAFNIHDLIGRTSEVSSRNISPHAAADVDVCPGPNISANVATSVHIHDTAFIAQVIHLNSKCTDPTHQPPGIPMPPRRRKPPHAGALTELPPLKIIRSIFLLQISYYLTATILIVFTTLVLGQRFSLPLILDWRSIRGDTTIGWTVGFAWLLAGFMTCVI